MVATSSPMQLGSNQLTWNDEGTNYQPLISREGMRKYRSYRDAAADRLRKNNNQVSYLTRLYVETGGKVDRKLRKRAIKATGLSWIQIYKWLFDKKLKDTAHKSFSDS